MQTHCDDCGGELFNGSCPFCAQGYTERYLTAGKIGKLVGVVVVVATAILVLGLALTLYLLRVKGV